MKDYDNLIVLDIETCGLDPNKNCMVSLGATHVASGKTFYKECQIYKESKVVDVALIINGFTKEEINDPLKPWPHEVLEEFIDWCETELKITKPEIGGHNVGSFDVQFLKEISKNHNTRWPFGYRYVDLHSIAYAFLKKSMSHDEICVALNLNVEDKPHNALKGAISEAHALKVLLGIIDGR